jgi:hypothetical protein
MSRRSTHLPPEPEEWLEPVSVVSMVQDTSGSGLIRILID